MADETHLQAPLSQQANPQETLVGAPVGALGRTKAAAAAEAGAAAEAANSDVEIAGEEAAGEAAPARLWPGPGEGELRWQGLAICIVMLL